MNLVWREPRGHVVVLLVGFRHVPGISAPMEPWAFVKKNPIVGLEVSVEDCVCHLGFPFSRLPLLLVLVYTYNEQLQTGTWNLFRPYMGAARKG